MSEESPRGAGPPLGRDPRRRIGLEVRDEYLPRTPRPFIQAVVESALEVVAGPDLNVSLLLTDEAAIGKLHARFLGDPSGTDVISFPMDDGVEIAVSVERAYREAAARGHRVEAELALYIIHGILHACGYSDLGEEERREMRETEKAILAKLCLEMSPVDPEPL